ncbi:MAG: SH3 domain-containing protein [Anaerolineae bacterium]
MAWRLRVRGGPGLEFPILGLLAYKQQVELIARNVQGTWLQIRLDANNVAWVSSRWIRVSRVLFRRLPIIGATSSGSPVLQGVSGTPQPGQGVGKINTYLLRGRNGPGLNYQQVGVLSLGTELIILGKSEDSQWYLVAVQGGSVWCFAPYVKVLTINGAALTTIPTPS